MKKFFFIFMMLMIASVISFAQDNANKKGISNIAVRAGYNLSNIIGDQINCNWKSGLNFGVTADYSFVDFLKLRSGLYATKKGYDSQDYEKFQYPHYFLEIPVLAVLNHSFNSKTNVEFQAGLYFAYGIAGKVKENGSTTLTWDWKEDPTTASPIPNQTYEQKVFDYNKRFDMGLNTGLGVNISNLYIGASYEMGFVNIFEYNPVHHHCLMANLGYRF